MATEIFLWVHLSPSLLLSSALNLCILEEQGPDHSSPLYPKLWAVLGTWWLFVKSSLEKGSVNCFVLNFKQTSLTIKKKRFILEPELERAGYPMAATTGIHEFKQDNCKRTHSLPYASDFCAKAIHSGEFDQVRPSVDPLAGFAGLLIFGLNCCQLSPRHSPPPEAVSESLHLSINPLWPPLIMSSVRHLPKLRKPRPSALSRPWAHGILMRLLLLLSSQFCLGDRTKEFIPLDRWTVYRSACIYYYLLN